MPLASENYLTIHTGVQQEIKQDFRWMNDISYVDSEKREHIISVMECLETCPDSKGERKTTRKVSPRRDTLIILIVTTLTMLNSADLLVRLDCRKRVSSFPM